VLTHTQILFFFQAGSQVAFSMHIKTRVFQYDYMQITCLLLNL
jgi:hypothetical protein